MSVARRTLLRSLPAAALVAHASGAGAQSTTALTRIAFGSCADQRKAQPIWDAVQAYRPELMLFLGDNVYGDAVPYSGEALRAAYAKADEIESYVRIRRDAPHTLAIWDDHDYGQNDGGADFAGKYDAKQAFLDFWRAPADDPRRGRDALYHATTYGPPGRRIQVVALDTRWFRSPLKRTDQRNAPGRERYVPDDDPAKTMLGDAQWRWLEERLREPAQLRLIASSVQVLADGHGWERWGNLPLERSRLYDLIASTGAGGVVFLSGDRHLGAIYRESIAGRRPMIDVTSSGFNQFYAQASEHSPNQTSPIYTHTNFGAIDVDWAARRLLLSLRGERGGVERSLDVRFDEIGA